MLSPRQAAQLHQAFLDDLVPRLAAGDFELHVAWALAEGEKLPDPWSAEAEITPHRQRGRDLGERLFNGLTDVADTPRALLVAIGGDHPELRAEEVEGAFDRLEGGAEVVIGPAEDGGYYLIALGARTLSPRLFADIDWGSATVLDSTIARCRSLGLEIELLPTGRDVDIPADLDWLAKIVQADPRACPNTERLLRRWGRLA